MDNGRRGTTDVCMHTHLGLAICRSLTNAFGALTGRSRSCALISKKGFPTKRRSVIFQR